MSQTARAFDSFATDNQFPLTRNFYIRITELENKIGAGLIEEVVQVAESEHQLVDVMVDAAV